MDRYHVYIYIYWNGIGMILNAIKSHFIPMVAWIQSVSAKMLPAARLFFRLRGPHLESMTRRRFTLPTSKHMVNGG